MKYLKYIVVFIFVFLLNYSAGWLLYIYDLNQSFTVNSNLSDVDFLLTNNEVFTYELIFRNFMIMKYSLLISIASTIFLMGLFKLNELKQDNNINNKQLENA